MMASASLGFFSYTARASARFFSKSARVSAEIGGAGAVGSDAGGGRGGGVDTQPARRRSARASLRIRSRVYDASVIRSIARALPHPPSAPSPLDEGRRLLGRASREAYPSS